MNHPPQPEPLHRWSIHDSAETYAIERWGRGLFSINQAGNVAVAAGNSSSSIDLKKLVDELAERGMRTPVLLRFSDILRSRIAELHETFGRAIEECGYQGGYRGVFPIKVNQAHRVIEEIVHFGAPYHYGLEAGSKAELLAILALHQDREALVICNGYKDDEYVRMALLGSKLGAPIILVAEKPSEIDRIHRVSEELGIPANYGIRVKLTAPGAGKWKHSGGDQSKFGLSPTELVIATEKLRQWGELDRFQLMHFHLGSQISAIRSIKNALREATRLYVELRARGCHSLQYLDVGGGLGVDYDGSQTNFPSSMNYSMQEYANDVVYEVMKVCDQAEAPHPNLVSESGRAIAAHHSVLIVDVLEVTRTAEFDLPAVVPDDAGSVLRSFFETYELVSRKNLIESYHDAVAYRDQGLQLFNLAHMNLEHRVLCDQLFWATCRKIFALLKDKAVPEELDGLERALCDTYFLNFSLFQSLPDAWAIDQLFPILPIHRHDEEPTRRGVLADITCDSDGHIDKFIDLRDVKDVLELHPVVAGEPYYLGIFLVGAYQEILGDLHNLFGDTNTVHVSIDDESHGIKTAIAGDTMANVLRYVNYEEDVLVGAMREQIASAQSLTAGEADLLMSAYQRCLRSYTYLGDRR